MQTIELHGHRVAYRRVGSGPVVVLIHGVAGTSALWEQLVRAVTPPEAALKANALLSQGEVKFGAELASAATHLPHKKSAIGAYPTQRLGHAKGAAITDRALAKLKAAVYKIPS